MFVPAVSVVNVQRRKLGATSKCKPHPVNSAQIVLKLCDEATKVTN